MAKKDRDENKELVQKLEKDIEEFSHDYEDVLTHHELVDNTEFLHKFADHIIQLDKDATDSDDEQASLVHHYLTTPLGAPFISNKTLLEAANSYDRQDPLNSDLHELVDGMIHFGDQQKNPLMVIFHSIEEHLKKEKQS
ncbi:MAG: hypothetical protein PVI40_06990 [Chlamydiota bacterium]|jgi:hypothetical protein